LQPPQKRSALLCKVILRLRPVCVYLMDSQTCILGEMRNEWSELFWMQFKIFLITFPLFILSIFLYLANLVGSRTIYEYYLGMTNIFIYKFKI